jgi:hypothetical protein
MPKLKSDNGELGLWHFLAEFQDGGREPAAVTTRQLFMMKLPF